MVKAGGILVCIVIIVLDIGAGILGLEAELEQSKVKQMRLWIFECKEPSHNAFRLGLGAVALLVVAHVLANLVGGCDCICSKDEFQKAHPNRQLTVSCLVFTWIIMVVGLSALVIGTRANDKTRASCGLTHHHFLSIGGILCFVHGLFSVAYYVSATASAHS
ncbi:hypothetical protein SAY87_020261 [Trapa incisa]|uniref:Uncharacterized protein n=2 Tax=Trapa TaxID=22665 RepID=A0AAN7M5H3_TRANT|nr:hypothetical protein SAY87_020261 [Trapa incisa]KAK4792157.1 hypothetical protein SAY86_022592 [Trapa natans]